MSTKPAQQKTWPACDYVSDSTIKLLECDPGAPPKVAWRRRLNSHANFLTEFNVTFTEAVKMIKLGYRLWTYIKEERSQGRTAPIDPFSRQIRASACHGVPLGGMGSGSIGRGFRGEFRRWQLLPGVCEEAPLLANQFSIFIKRDNGEKFSSVLYPGQPSEIGLVDNTGISSWDWNLDGERSSYHAVFPRSWTIYDGEPDPNIKISCRQVSPFIPNNYKDSCLPATVFSYTLINTGKDDAIVSLLLTWMNSIGGESHFSGGHFNECFREDDGVSGVLLHHKTANRQPPVTFAIAAQMTDEVDVSVFPCFTIQGKDNQGTSARDMWKEIKEHGMFNGKHWHACPTGVSPPGEAIGGAVSATVLVPTQQKKKISFSVVWDSPKIEFLKGRSYYRRYTKFYGHSGKAATRLAHDVILEHPRWESAIANWQAPILEDSSLPEWYRFTLFNELYYLVAGGTVWTESEAANLKGESLGVKGCQNSECLCSSDNVNYDKRKYGMRNNEQTSRHSICGYSARSLVQWDEEQAILCTVDTAGAGKLSGMNQGDANVQDIAELTSLSIGETEVVAVQYVNEDTTPCYDNTNLGGYASEIVGNVDTSDIENSFQDNLQLHNGKRAEGTFLQQDNENVQLNDEHEDIDNVGRFLYLEGLEYVMWCTYDVHFYASFALLELFPKLELSIQQEFAAATMSDNKEKTRFLTEADWGIRKVLGAVPHDLGMHDPWIEVNAYNIHDTSRWKDLNCKFVLQVYRDFVATQDMTFARNTLASMLTAMAYMDKFDKDRDGLIENDGFPDQTYDTWTVHGVSAYCGGLWLAALQAAAAMSEKLSHSSSIETFKSKFLQARAVYEKKLWNGSYFSYDSGTSSNSNSIHADQLAGQLYMFASGLSSLFDEEKIKTTLRTIYNFNVLKVKGGKLGAVNGMHPNGKVDETCMQSREIWTGVTYALAATMIHAGMIEEAFHTAEGVFNTGWSDEGFGYWFQTPEGWTINGHYRSLAYMRPLAIWAMQNALDLRRSSKKNPNNEYEELHQLT